MVNFLGSNVYVWYMFFPNFYAYANFKAWNDDFTTILKLNYLELEMFPYGNCISMVVITFIAKHMMEKKVSCLDFSL